MLQRLATEAAAPELLIYLQVTRGTEYGRNHLFPKDVKPTAFAFASPYPAPSPRPSSTDCAQSRWRTYAGTAATSSRSRCSATCCCRQEAADRGADEALLTRDGLLLEGSSSSVFLCVGGTLVTPPNSHRILPGTSRDAVLELAAGWLPCEICDVEARDIASSDEVWIASAGRGVLPVTSVNGEPVGGGRPGPLWSAMYARLQQHLDEHRVHARDLSDGRRHAARVSLRFPHQGDGRRDRRLPQPGASASSRGTSARRPRAASRSARAAAASTSASPSRCAPGARRR